ncbi:hypothetical protein [uncultured Rhodoblastus sp.]|uniref:hypothetical protein n=1 Tax=uncultured Rhodoblastus sp. TaxID=543037 RepID=UPI0025EF6A5A|nr:hypothetical protein [uncultured Rhodoblastus sp.]
MASQSPFAARTGANINKLRSARRQPFKSGAICFEAEQRRPPVPQHMMEDMMSKGQVRSNKEAKKPKSDQAQSKKHAPSDYQRSLGKDAPTDDPFKKKG